MISVPVTAEKQTVSPYNAWLTRWAVSLIWAVLLIWAQKLLLSGNSD